MRPLIAAMRADGHEVEVTARDFAQTLELCERFGIEHTAVGHHRGGGRGGKAAGLVSRSLALTRWARGRRFDVSMGHGSNDVTVASRLLRIPSATAFDYEFAVAQHNVNCRLARAVVVPDAIPPERLYRYGARGKLRPLRRASRRSTTSRTSSRTRPCCASSRSTATGRSWWCARHPTCRSTTASRTRSSAGCSTGCGRSGSQAVVLPRTPEQRRELAAVEALRGARARCGRAEPRGLRGSRDLRRRDDEPRGGGARHAGVHDVRGAARRGGRAAARGRPPAPARRRLPRSSSGAANAQGGLRDAARPARTRHTSALGDPNLMRTIRSSVNLRRVGQIGVDVGLIALAYYLSYVLRFDEGIPHRYEDLLQNTIGFVVAMKLVVFAPSASTRSSGASSTRRTWRRSSRRWWWPPWS